MIHSNRVINAAHFFVSFPLEVTKIGEWCPHLKDLSALHLAHVEEELLALLLLVGQEPELA